MPPPRPLPAHLQRRPFTVAEARAAGVSAQRLRASDLRAPHRGVRVPVSLPDTLATRTRAALLLMPPGAAVGGLHAAALCGLPTPLDWAADHHPLRLRLPPGSSHAAVDGVRTEVAQTPWTAASVRCADGERIPVVHPRDLWATLAAELSFVDAVALGDAVRRVWADDAAMAQAAAALGRGRRGRAARQVLAAVRYPVDSAMETRLRLLLIAAGLPEPRCGRDVPDPAGGWVARPDLSWPTYRVAVEYDGGHHRTDPRQWADDITRRQGLEALGWRVIVVTARALLRHPEQVVAQVGAALRAQGARW